MDVFNTYFLSISGTSGKHPKSDKESESHVLLYRTVSPNCFKWKDAGNSIGFIGMCDRCIHAFDRFMDIFKDTGQIYFIYLGVKNNMDENIAIQVKNVTVRFNMASERIDNLKEYFVKLMKRELMFQEFLALKDVSFTVKKGEAWGIVGTNGSGKSTLLKLICGILKPYKGEVYINGNIAPLIELGAGFDGDLTARENIFLNGAVLGFSTKYMQEHCDEIVEFAELQDFLDMPIKNYSSGMAARLGFSIATVVKPEILIVDEVLSVGDYAFQQKCEKRMHELLGNGTTLLYVSHSIDSVKDICDHALWLDKGVVRMAGDVESVANAYMGECTHE